jgi:hypothetical protein
MGVTGTFCQLCAMPVQHDHYVPLHGRFAIYRGAAEGGGRDWSAERPFPFGPEHAWLKDAVAVDRFGEGVSRGLVEDGHLEDPEKDDSVFVWNGGDEDAYVFHHHCWEATGKPTSGPATIRATGLLPYSVVSLYHEQLFQFRELEADGKAWMLRNPASEPRNRERVEQLIDLATRKPSPGRAPSSLGEVVSMDRDWHSTTVRGDTRHHLVHFRRAPDAQMDLSPFPHLLALVIRYSEDARDASAEELGRIQALMFAFKAALERGGFGVHVLSSCGQGLHQHFAYVKDLAEGHRLVDALPERGPIKPDDYDDAHDPAWEIFFQQRG